MPTPRETVLTVLYTLLSALPATALLGDVLPERVPAANLLILRDGDLCHHPAGLVPGCRLILELAIAALDRLGRSASGPLEQMVGIRPIQTTRQNVSDIDFFTSISAHRSFGTPKYCALHE